MWQTRKRTCVWRIGNEGGCLHRSLAIVYFVTSNLMLDLPAIGRASCHSQATFAQASDVVYTEADPPPSQAAINRGAEKPRALGVMRLNQTSLGS